MWNLRTASISSGELDSCENCTELCSSLAFERSVDPRSILGVKDHVQLIYGIKMNGPIIVAVSVEIAMRNTADELSVGPTKMPQSPRLGRLVYFPNLPKRRCLGGLPVLRHTHVIYIYIYILYHPEKCAWSPMAKLVELWSC